MEVSYPDERFTRPLEHLEFTEHIAVERVVDVQLDPVEATHAALKVFGKFVEYHSRRRALHLRNDAVGPSALLSVVRRATVRLPYVSCSGNNPRLNSVQSPR